MPFLKDFQEALELESELTPHRVCELLNERWGGCSVYVGVRFLPDVTGADTVRSLQQKGYSRSTAYRKIRRRLRT